MPEEFSLKLLLEVCNKIQLNEVVIVLLNGCNEQSRNIVNLLDIGCRFDG